MKPLHAVVVALLVVTGSALHAQGSDVRVGFGVSFGEHIFTGTMPDNIFTPIAVTSFSVPLYLTKTFRVEPRFGILSYSWERTYTDNTTSTSSTTNFLLGAGLHYIIPALAGAENVSAYIGPQVQVVPLSTTDKSATPGSTEETTSQSNLILGMLLGGEYAVARSFTVGAEVQFNYISIGEEKSTPSSGTTGSVSEHYLNIATAVTLRFYFN